MACLLGSVGGQSGGRSRFGYPSQGLERLAPNQSYSSHLSSVKEHRKIVRSCLWELTIANDPKRSLNVVASGRGYRSLRDSFIASIEARAMTMTAAP
jgi:hypothetical protein